MMWFLIVIGGLITLPFVVGLLMPERYHGRVEVEFAQSDQQVWEALEDIEAHPMTGKMMKTIKPLPPERDRPTWREDMGRAGIVTVTTATYESPRHLVRQMSSASPNMTSRWEYRLEPVGEGCRVTLSGTTDIPSGSWNTPLFRFMMGVGGGVKKGLHIQLDMVAATLGTEARSTAA